MVRKRYPNLREFLKQTGRTQEEFASRLGISQPQLSKIVNGKQRPKLELALEIAGITGVPLESLVPEEAA